MEIPRPRDLHPNAKWNKYCLIGEDWQKLNSHEFLEKHETGFCDFVSVHIKVHGLEDRTAKTWTRKVKEYFELLQGSSAAEPKFPFFFSQRDLRGEVTIGKQFGKFSDTELHVFD
jgi:hypothetical protein